MRHTPVCADRPAGTPATPPASAQPTDAPCETLTCLIVLDLSTARADSRRPRCSNIRVVPQSSGHTAELVRREGVFPRSPGERNSHPFARTSRGTPIAQHNACSILHASEPGRQRRRCILLPLRSSGPLARTASRPVVSRSRHTITPPQRHRVERPARSVRNGASPSTDRSRRSRPALCACCRCSTRCSRPPAPRG